MTAPQTHGGAPAAAPRQRSRVWRTLVAIVLVLATLAAVGFVFTRFWAANSHGAAVVENERKGVTYIKPVARLLGHLVAARTAAVRGDRPRASTVRAAVSAVESVDKEYGDDLGTRQRWSKLSDKIDITLTADPRGPAASQEYGDLVIASQQLITKAGDESGLVTGSGVDVHYLAGLARRSLPQVIVTSGSLLDMAILANGKANSETMLSLTVMRAQLLGAVEEVATGVRRSVDATANDDLGPNLVGHLDAFRSAANTVAPVALTSLPALTPSPADMLAAIKAETVRAMIDTTQDFLNAILRELDALLRAELDAYDAERTRAIVGAALAVLLLVLIFWQLLPSRHDGQPTEAPIADEQVAQPGPVGAEPGAPDGDMPPDRYDLVDARRLAGEDELVHMGRAIRPSRQEAGGDPH